MVRSLIPPHGFGQKFDPILGPKWPILHEPSAVQESFPPTLFVGEDPPLTPAASRNLAVATTAG